ncbi:hypothetical protein FALCPG4_012682 [Fusarium falciforme]
MEPPTDIETLAEKVAALSDELKSANRPIAQPERRQETMLTTPTNTVLENEARRHARHRERPSGSRRRQLLSRPRDAIS